MGRHPSRPFFFVRDGRSNSAKAGRLRATLFPSRRGLLDSLHLHPFASLAGLKHGIGHVICCQSIPKIGSCRRAILKPLHEVSNLMHKAVLVPELEARHPPVSAIGMVAVAHMDAPPAADLALIA